LTLVSFLFFSFRLAQALNHPYFFALPYPTHPSKLPKTAAQAASAAAQPLDEVDGNIEPSGPGGGAKASKKLKRKLSGHDMSRNIARKLDFTAT
jgi:cyclin-dependent kinase 7